MENNVNQIPAYAEKERVLPGILGALLFSLAGGIIWFVLWQIDIIAGISGIVGVICAIKGYEIFAKKSSTKGVVIASVFALLVIVFAWYLCLCQDVYNAFAEMGLPITFGESFELGVEFLKDPEVGGGYISDLAFGVIFAIVGAIGYVVQSAKNAKAVKAMTPKAPVLNGGEEVSNEIPKE